MTTNTIKTSTWLSSTSYEPNGDGTGTLAIWLTRGGGMLYENVPAWLVGLLHAGIAKGGDRSVGRAYNRLVKGQYPYTAIEPARAAGMTSDELCDALTASLAA